MIENEAVGTFDVKLAPIGAGVRPIGGMSIDKVAAWGRCWPSVAASRDRPVTLQWNG